MTGKTTTEDIIRKPEYHECDRCVVFPGGLREPELEYYARVQHFRNIAEEQDREARCEAKIKAYEANVFIEEAATCQSLSVAISRARRRLGWDLK